MNLTTHHRLRGADSVYVAVAEAFNATLITWDAERKSLLHQEEAKTVRRLP